MVIRSKTRKVVLDRDDNSCRKCGRRASIHVHHIVARQDGGSDDPDNLAVLCSACHAEWHAIEQVSDLGFDAWTEMPTVAEFCAAFSVPWPEDVSAAKLREIVFATHRLRMDERKVRLSTNSPPDEDPL